MMEVRVAAARVVAATIQGEASLASLMPEYQVQVEERDRALLQELCFGTLRNFYKLNAIVAELLRKPFKSKDSDLLALLCCAIYQLSNTRIPPHAAISQSVNAATALKKTWAKGLINGILRRYQRENTAIVDKIEKNADYATNHPKWLRTRIQNAWPNQANEILNANNDRPPLTLRVNLRETSRENYSILLENAGICHKLCPIGNVGITLDNSMNVTALPHFADGWVSVQDEAAQLAAPLLELHSGQRVLDACCAPGGKTCHILETEPELAELVGLDADEKRLHRVQENFERLRLSARLVHADATDSNSWWDQKPFDRILLDAPCSGTGVIRRHPDIKLLRRPEDIDKLVDLQSNLLTALWPLLKEGGLLLYATCSILPEENLDVVARFVEQQANASMVPLEINGETLTCGMQLFPQSGGHDGFYYALLKKTG